MTGLFSGAHLHVGGGPEVEEAADGLGAASPGSQVQRCVPCTVQFIVTSASSVMIF